MPCVRWFKNPSFCQLYPFPRRVNLNRIDMVKNILRTGLTGRYWGL